MKQQLDLLLDSVDVVLEIASTNDFFKLNYKTCNSNTILRAIIQTSGRGQFDRVWQSNNDENLTFSILYKKVSINLIQEIKDNISNAIIKLLNEHYHIKARFKAPNDIYVEDKKLCGILIETGIDNNNRSVFEYVIIGIGLNVNQISFEQLPNATSMRLESDIIFNIENILKQFIKTYNDIYI